MQRMRFWKRIWPKLKLRMFKMSKFKLLKDKKNSLNFINISNILCAVKKIQNKLSQLFKSLLLQENGLSNLNGYL